MFMFIFVFMLIIYVYDHVCAYSYVCVYVYFCVCVYVYLYVCRLVSGCGVVWLGLELGLYIFSQTSIFAYRYLVGNLIFFPKSFLLGSNPYPSFSHFFLLFPLMI